MSVLTAIGPNGMANELRCDAAGNLLVAFGSITPLSTYYTATGGETVVTTAVPYAAGNEIVFLNGQQQNVPGDYAETSPTSITFTVALTAGALVTIVRI